MKIRKTFVFMFKNPTPIFLYVLLCWILFSALTTIADDPFIYGTLSDASDEVRESTQNLPWSLWKFCTALSLMIEEIAQDFSYSIFLYALLPALFIGYLEARGGMKGIDEQRSRWMNWYSKKNEMIELSESTETSQMIDSERDASIPEMNNDTNQSMLFFPMNLIIHFGYWIVVLVLISLIMQIDKGISASLQIFIEFLPQFLIPSALLALVSCYRQTRGFQKGCNAEQQVWINWHNSQKDLLVNGENIEEPPSTTGVVSQSYYKKFIDTILFMLRRPKQMLIQFFIWNIVGIVFIFTLSGLYGGLTYFPSLDHIVSVTLHFCSVPAAIFTVIISYREAKGNLMGMDSEQQVWNRWYSQQQETQEGLPISDTNNSETYLKDAKNIIISMAHKPQQVLLHLFCWIVGFILIYGITNLIVLEILPDYGQFILVFTLAFISSYQEMKGNQNGRNNQRKTWLNWYDQQNQDADKESEFSQSPPMLEVY